jgi:predicted DNA binding protein
MISLQMDMVQYDCPYIDTTARNDVSFLTKQWDFDPAAEELETRIVVRGADSEALDNGLQTLRDHENVREYDLIKREQDLALLRSRIRQTDAMETIRSHDGYITGPFEIEDGSEIWNVGFDREERADGALSALSKDNDFTVESRESMGLEGYYELMENADVARSLLDGCRGLSAVERETVRTAVEEGYFGTPREGTLSTLAAELDVSKMAVSKNLRRSERKLFECVVGALDELERAGTD